MILVRNQEAKDQLPGSFKGCLVMTVTESKGLEFDDVFLWCEYVQTLPVYICSKCVCRYARMLCVHLSGYFTTLESVPKEMDTLLNM